MPSRIMVLDDAPEIVALFIELMLTVPPSNPFVLARPVSARPTLVAQM